MFTKNLIQYMNISLSYFIFLYPLIHKEKLILINPDINRNINKISLKIIFAKV